MAAPMTTVGVRLLRGLMIAAALIAGPGVTAHASANAEFRTPLAAVAGVDEPTDQGGNEGDTDTAGGAGGDTGDGTEGPVDTDGEEEGNGESTGGPDAATDQEPADVPPIVWVGAAALVAVALMLTLRRK